MVFDLPPGDVIRIGEGVTLTVLAMEGDQIRFGLELPEIECPDPGLDCKDVSPKEGWWGFN
jgi:hypothetical protein